MSDELKQQTESGYRNLAAGSLNSGRQFNRLAITDLRRPLKCHLFTTRQETNPTQLPISSSVTKERRRRRRWLTSEGRPPSRPQPSESLLAGQQIAAIVNSKPFSPRQHRWSKNVAYGHLLSVFIITNLHIFLINSGQCLQSGQNRTNESNQQLFIYTLPQSINFGSARYVYPRTLSSSPREPANHSPPPPPPPIANSPQYRYELAASEQYVSDSERLKLDRATQLKNQIIGLKEDLERQLTHDREEAKIRARPVALGSPCLAPTDCNRWVTNSHCKLDSFTCSCLPNHVEYNSTTCLPSALLGFKCSIDSQCEHRVANSQCLESTKVCSCKANFIPYRLDKCLPASKINDYCLSNEQCHLSDRHSYCQWRITNIYGHCKCPPNYKQMRDSANTTTGGIKCVPRLGDVCLHDDECRLATPNSLCRRPAANSSTGNSADDSQARPFAWKSSLAGNAERRCLCGQGFALSPNRLECIADPTTSVAPAAPFASQPGFALSASMDARHQYDLVVAAAGASATTAPATEAPESSANSSSSRNFSAPKSTTTTTTSTTTTPKPKTPRIISSLGKSCQSSAECKARDPHSACVDGICECLRPTEKCRSNSTGCYRDTFQCRNGQCISWYFVCDKFRNCLDGSDEDECQPGSCPHEAFQCLDGQCLARAKLCNGNRDCLDGSDEFDCPAGRNSETLASLSTVKQKQQSETEFAPPASQQSPYSSSGRSGSSSSSSINGGDNTTILSATSQSKCHPRAFTCDSGHCLPGYVFCNAVEDCPDGSDERPELCERSIAGIKVPEQTDSSVSSVSIEAEQKQDSTLAWPISQRSPAKDNYSQQQLKLEKPTPMPPSKAGQLEDSPLVKTDRLDINKMLASLSLPGGRRTMRPGSVGSIKPEAGVHPNRTKQRQRQSRLLSSSSRARQLQRLTTKVVGSANELTCPKQAFACANGKCRSTAILCSGVDGCGDYSDENQCEVCQCEAP